MRFCAQREHRLSRLSFFFMSTHPCKHGGGVSYTAIVMCAFAHFLTARNCTQREHRLLRLSFFFMSTHPCKHGGGVSYTAIVMCAFVHFLAAHFCAQREHRLSRLSFFFMSTHPCKHGGGHKKRTLSQVRVFALAGAIGIEPTQWESEAQVLPLHQAPSR